MSLAILAILVLPALVLVAGLHDMATFTIPNWISIALALAFPVAAVLAGLPLAQVGLCFAVGAVMLAVGVGMFAAGWIGGGDAKLLAAAALWIGWPSVINFVLITALAGGALAVMLLGARQAGFGLLVAQGPAWLTRLLDPKEAAPYGVAIAFGALATFPSSAVFTAALG